MQLIIVAKETKKTHEKKRACGENNPPIHNFGRKWIHKKNAFDEIRPGHYFRRKTTMDSEKDLRQTAHPTLFIVR